MCWGLLAIAWMLVIMWVGIATYIYLTNAKEPASHRLDAVVPSQGSGEA